MRYRVAFLSLFEQQAKRLAKKYPSLKNDLNQLAQRLAENPRQGKKLGKHFYKVRLAITSKGKGKSGGARVITYLKATATTVYLVSIYDKSEKATISDQELDKVFRDELL